MMSTKRSIAERDEEIEEQYVCCDGDEQHYVGIGCNVCKWRWYHDECLESLYGYSPKDIKGMFQGGIKYGIFLLCINIWYIL